MPIEKQIIWDRLVRTTHWLSASLFLITYFFLEEGELLHRWAGYTVFATTCVRILWGFIGPPNARFKNFIPTYPSLKQHIVLLCRASREKGFLHKGSLETEPGHNPLGALMVLVLLTGLLLTAISGWMQTLDYFWGSDGVELFHELSANITLYAAGVHVLAVFVMSRLYASSLVYTMLTGKRARHHDNN